MEDLTEDLMASQEELTAQQMEQQKHQQESQAGAVKALKKHLKNDLKLPETESESVRALGAQEAWREQLHHERQRCENLSVPCFS